MLGLILIISIIMKNQILNSSLTLSTNTEHSNLIEYVAELLYQIGLHEIAEKYLIT